MKQIIKLKKLNYWRELVLIAYQGGNVPKVNDLNKKKLENQKKALKNSRDILTNEADILKSLSDSEDDLISSTPQQNKTRRRPRRKTAAATAASEDRSKFPEQKVKTQQRKRPIKIPGKK